MVFLDMAMSLDGYVAGPDGGDGGLHDWYFAPDGDGDGPAVLADLAASIGAMILGRRAFGTAPDGFDTPYAVPHVVLTHTARPTVHRGGASFSFVTGGPEAALAAALAGAGERDVCVAGGAETARAFLDAGLLDEVRIHLVPVVLGGGLRLFDGAAPVRLERPAVLQSGGATHLRFRVAG